MSEIGDFKNMVSTIVSAQGKATTASTSELVSKAELWDAIHQYVSDYGDQFREPPPAGVGKRCNASRNELAETIDRLYLAAAPSREAAPSDDEVALLRAEVREWLCIDCNTVFPGPPQNGFACVQCPKCNGPTGPRGLMERRKLMTEIADLRTALTKQAAPTRPNE